MIKERMFKISETNLRMLVAARAKLVALENGGVNNWDWYSESLHDSPLWDDEEYEFNVDEDIHTYAEAIDEESKA